MSAAKSTTKRKTTTAKKPTAKKPASRTSVKKTAKKPAKKPAKKTASAAKSRKQNTVQSFRIQPETGPFLTTQLRRETLYWLILGAIAIAFTLWINHLHNQVQDLYDIVDKNIAEETILDTEYAQKLKEAKQ